MTGFSIPAAPETGSQGLVLVQDTLEHIAETPATAEEHAAETHAAAEEHAAEEASHAAEMWVAVAFVLMLVIIAKPAWKAIAGGLDKRSAAIRQELEEAQRLREEAQTALASFQRRHQDALHEAEAIIAHARAEADRARAEAAADIDQMLARREALAMQRIAQAETAAVAEVRNLAVDIAVEASRKLIAANTDAAQGRALIDQAIAELPQKLH